MNVENKEDSKRVESQNVDKNIDKSRRSFARTGVIAPIIMGFTSRPAWAAMDNCSFGQALSGNLSQHPATCDSDTPSTVSPITYQTPANWAIYGVNSLQSYKFNIVFGSPQVKVQNSPTLNDPTLIEVIQGASNKVSYKSNSLPTAPDAYSATQHYIAAYLNAMSPNLIFPFKASDIISDWGQWNLFSILQSLQASNLNALQANQYINFYN